MAKTARSGVKPPETWRCLIAGCAIEGVWQQVIPGEEYEADPADPRSHYFRVHYVESEADYQQRLRDQKALRMAHYRETGEFLPPSL